MTGGAVSLRLEYGDRPGRPEGLGRKATTRQPPGALAPDPSFSPPAECLVKGIQSVVIRVS